MEEENELGKSESALKCSDLFAHAEQFALFRNFWNFCREQHPEVFDEFMKIERENNLLFEQFMKSQD